MYEKAGREGLAVKEKLEFDILNAYLPAMMDEGEIRQLVQSVIIETKAKALSDIGKVMPIIMQKGGSKIDGKIANQILRELLEKMAWFLDGAAILFILFLGYIGFNRGLIEELGRLIGLIIAILISMSNTKSISDKIVGIVGLDDWIIKILTFTLLFIVTIVLTRLLTKMLNIAILSKNNQMMNQSLGFTFGAFKGFFIIMTILWFIALLPKQKWTSFMGKKSNILIISNQFRISIISFFNWDDPVELSESYIKQLTQP